MSFFKPQVSFASDFASLFTVMKDNSSVLFRSNLIYFAQKVVKVKLLRILSAQVKIHEILAISETTNQFFFSVMRHNSSILF